MDGRKEMNDALQTKLNVIFEEVRLPLEQKVKMREKIWALIEIASANKNLPEQLEDLDEPESLKG